MNLWLDDLRPAPKGWLWARNVQEAKDVLLNVEIEQASLDHDLGDIEETGYTLVCWMEETGHWPLFPPTVHSQNPVGKAKMEQAINHSFPKERSL